MASGLLSGYVRHGVLMSSHVSTGFSGQKELQYQTAAGNLLLEQEYLRLSGIFSAERIPFIPLKGIALAFCIYEHPGLRRIGDMDILIRADDFSRADALLKKEGYLCPGVPPLAPVRYSIYLNSLPYSKSGPTSCIVHLHWHLLNSTLPLFMYRINMDEVWDNARIPPHSRGRMLAPAHQIVYLALHAFNHSFEQDKWLEDIARVIARYEGSFSWEEVYRTARSWKAEVPLSCALRLCRGDVARGDTLLKKGCLPGGRPLYRLISDIRHKGAGTHNQVYQLYLCMAGGLIARLRFVFLTVFPPPRILRHIYAAHATHSLIRLYWMRLVWAVKSAF